MKERIGDSDRGWMLSAEAEGTVDWRLLTGAKLAEIVSTGPAVADEHVYVQRYRTRFVESIATLAKS